MAYKTHKFLDQLLVNRDADQDYEPVPLVQLYNILEILKQEIYHRVLNTLYRKNTLNGINPGVDLKFALDFMDPDTTQDGYGLITHMVAKSCQTNLDGEYLNKLNPSEGNLAILNQTTISKASISSNAGLTDFIRDYSNSESLIAGVNDTGDFGFYKIINVDPNTVLITEKHSILNRAEVETYTNDLDSRKVDKRLAITGSTLSYEQRVTNDISSYIVGISQRIQGVSTSDDIYNYLKYTQQQLLFGKTKVTNAGIKSSAIIRTNPTTTAAGSADEKLYYTKSDIHSTTLDDWYEIAIKDNTYLRGLGFQPVTAAVIGNTNGTWSVGDFAIDELNCVLLQVTAVDGTDQPTQISVICAAPISTVSLSGNVYTAQSLNSITGLTSYKSFDYTIITDAGNQNIDVYLMQLYKKAWNAFIIAIANRYTVTNGGSGGSGANGTIVDADVETGTGQHLEYAINAFRSQNQLNIGYGTVNNAYIIYDTGTSGGDDSTFLLNYIGADKILTVGAIEQSFLKLVSSMVIDPQFETIHEYNVYLGNYTTEDYRVVTKGLVNAMINQALTSFTDYKGSYDFIGTSTISLADAQNYVINYNNTDRPAVSGSTAFIFYADGSTSFSSSNVQVGLYDGSTWTWSDIVSNRIPTNGDWIYVGDYTNISATSIHPGRFVWTVNEIDAISFIFIEDQFSQNDDVTLTENSSGKSTFKVKEFQVLDTSYNVLNTTTANNIIYQDFGDSSLNDTIYTKIEKMMNILNALDNTIVDLNNSSTIEEYVQRSARSTTEIPNEVAVGEIYDNAYIFSDSNRKATLSGTFNITKATIGTLNPGDKIRVYLGQTSSVSGSIVSMLGYGDYAELEVVSQNDAYFTVEGPIYLYINDNGSYDALSQVYPMVSLVTSTIPQYTDGSISVIGSTTGTIVTIPEQVLSNKLVCDTVVYISDEHLQQLIDDLELI